MRARAFSGFHGDRGGPPSRLPWLLWKKKGRGLWCRWSVVRALGGGDWLARSGGEVGGVE